jgi:hypothetical protein
MKLMIEKLSRLTKLSIPTLRVYASRQNLGKKVGNKRVFSQADVKKLLEGSRKTQARRRATTETKKQGATKKPIKAEPIRASVGQPKVTDSTRGTPSFKSRKPSFWTRLFGGRRAE